MTTGTQLGQALVAAIGTGLLFALFWLLRAGLRALAAPIRTWQDRERDMQKGLAQIPAEAKRRHR